MRNELYPLQFKEVIRNYDFGDRNIPKLYPNKDLPQKEIIAETWEITAHPDDPGEVAEGLLKGQTLPELVKDFGPQLVGEDIYPRYGDRFPLLLKFLDAQKDLEVQIHPDDQYTQENNLDQLGKPEAWYILDAKPGATLYWGTKEGVTKENLREVGPDEEKMRDLLMEVPVEVGDVIYLPPGKVHAIGKDIVLFEIQQTSDVTIGPDYLFLSGNKVDDVNPKEAFNMFLDQISIEDVPTKRATIPSISFSKGGNQFSYLLATKYFCLEEWRLKSEFILEQENFSVLTVLNGELSIETGSSEVQLFPGKSVLLPASLHKIHMRPIDDSSKLLKSYVPNLKRDVVEPLLKQGYSRNKIELLGG